MTNEKKGATPCESAPNDFDTADSTPPARPVFWPLTWYDEKPASFRGKGKRNARRAARARRGK